MRIARNSLLRALRFTAVLALMACQMVPPVVVQALAAEGEVSEEVTAEATPAEAEQAAGEAAEGIIQLQLIGWFSEAEAARLQEVVDRFNESNVNIHATLNLVVEFPELHPFLDSADFAYPWQFPSGFQDFIDVFNASLEAALAGIVLPEDMLVEVEEVGNDILRK